MSKKYTINYRHGLQAHVGGIKMANISTADTQG
jgi:hypothetical protein